MCFLATCEDPFSLEDLAKRIRKTSNFRFNWQFYSFSGIDPESPIGVRKALEEIIATPTLHQFLRDSFEPMYEDSFKIDPLHEHCRLAVAAGDFEDILASAANNLSGAYSPSLRSANRKEQLEIEQLFEQLGQYDSFQLLPGAVAGCAKCRSHTSHYFTNWYFGVAWDWCLLATWRERRTLWMGCLSDTD